MLEHSLGQNTTNLFLHLKKYQNKDWYKSQSLQFHTSLPAAITKQQRTAGCLHETLLAVAVA